MRHGILSVDLGSSSAKVVLFAPDGTPLAEAGADYPTAAPAEGWQEQAPADWLAALRAAIGRIGLDAAPAAVALSGSMQNLILLDAAGEALRPAILYSDGRAGAEFQAAADTLTAIGADALCGNAPEVLMPLFKARWLQRHEPARWAGTATLLFGAKEYLAARLTGIAATDPATASTSGLMAFGRLGWSPALAEAAGIPPAWLPPILPATHRLGRVTADGAAATGIPEGTVVINGCGDAAAAALGAGPAHVCLGTSGWAAALRPAAERARFPAAYALAHPFDPARFVAIAPILAAGDCVAWLRELTGQPPDALDRLVAAADAAPGRPLFLPYLKGERSPFADPALRGAFLELGRDDGPGALAYAVLEGVAFALRHAAGSLAIDDGMLALIGGGADSPVWPQLIADVMGAAVSLPQRPALVTALGAFRIAARALGLPPAPAAPARIVQPRPERRARVAARYDAFLAATAFARSLAAGR